MMRRAFISLIGSLAIAWPLASYAQQPKEPLKRIGILADTCSLQPNNLIVRRLGELGWIEGQTIVFDCVSTIGRLDQLPTLARELISRRPDLLTAGPYTLIRALQQETTTIPIVMLNGWEPVRAGLITSLARPGGNLTGVAWSNLVPKRMELLKQIVPNLKRVAWIRGMSGQGSPEAAKIQEDDQQIAASALKFTWQVFDAVVASDYDVIFAHVAAERFDAVYVPSSPLNVQNKTHICQLVSTHRIPAAAEWDAWAKCGFLLTYGEVFSWGVARAMDYVDKILRGAKPSDLPVEQATKFLLTINLKTAKELGLTVPPSLLVRADEVIE